MNTLAEFFTRQRNPQMRTMSFLLISMHWIMVWKYLEGYFSCYLPIYEIKHPSDSTILSTCLVILFSCLAAWAYIMAQFTDPGHLNLKDFSFQP